MYEDLKRNSAKSLQRFFSVQERKHMQRSSVVKLRRLTEIGNWQWVSSGKMLQGKESNVNVTTLK